MASNEWYTPSLIIEAARRTMGGIDLDPASCEEANLTVKAAQYITKSGNGLTQRWDGRVWLNPPWSGNMLLPFMDKLVKELPHIDQACLLLPFAGFSRWHNVILPKLDAISIMSFPVKFTNVDRPLSRCVTWCGYIGPNTEDFFREFRPLGNTFLK